MNGKSSAVDMEITMQETKRLAERIDRTLAQETHDLAQEMEVIRGSVWEILEKVQELATTGSPRNTWGAHDVAVFGHRS